MVSKYEYVECSKVIDIRDGTHDSPEYIIDGYPLVTSKNIKDGKIDFTNVNYISEEDFNKINFRSSVDRGDILMPMIGTIGNPVVVLDTREFAIKNVALFKFKDNKVVDNQYFYYLLKSPIINNQLMGVKRGGTQSFVSLTNIRKLKIPLASMDIQTKISNTLDQAQSLIDKRKAQIADLDKFIQSVFLEMFGDPVRNDKHLKMIKLNQVADWKSGGTPSRSIMEYYQGDIPWLSSGELNQMYTFISNEKITIDGIKNSSAKLIPKGSLLLGMYDTAALKSTINMVDCTCNQAIVFGKIEDSICNTLFVYHCIQIGKDCYKSQQRGVRQKNLNLSMIKNLEILYPTLPLQNKFAQIVEKTEQQKDLLQQSLTQLEDNFNSLMQRAFKGELFN